MHGRPRKPSKPEDTAASAAKAEKLRLLQSQLLHNHHQRIYTKEALDVSSKLIEVNPEVYTAWNYRKLAISILLNEATDPGDMKSIVDGELRIVEIALRRNPKCYGAWYHRKWVLGRKLREADFDFEFRLLDQLLKADSRNFHGWNYRRFVVALKGVSEEEELKFMNDKIEANFSNYSAWHNRSVLLSQLLLKKDNDIFPRDKVLSEEFDLVHQALFTDPDDQSGWFYYLWLLNQTISTCNPLLVTSWPSNRLNLILSTNEKTAQEAIYLGHHFHSFAEKGFPIVLYFSQAVKGVSSSTVNLLSSFVNNKELVWLPLSTSKSTESKIWMTSLKLPDVNTTYPVEVRVGHSPGIISSSGHALTAPYQFGFTLDLSCTRPEKAKQELENMVTWEDDDFYQIGNFPKEIDVAYFSKLEISEDHGHRNTINDELNLFHEALESKIGKLTLARLLVAHSIVSKKTIPREVLELYEDLIKLDPSHTGYYKDEKSLVLMDQVTSDKASLEKYCLKRKKSLSSGYQEHTILQLKNLSLSRIGFSERLLWVQSLDLSHNDLRSITGLEALQLLSCLNLRNNRISSFSSLESLKLMHSLEVLDISYNEIGGHPIDTARYVCASPLSHSATGDSNCVKFTEDNEAFENWEAVLLFQGLRLNQLNIVGNKAATDGLRSLLVQVLPTLKWLDGSRL